MQRLSVALAAAALVVALLGTTPLGQAARDVVKSGVTLAKKASGAHAGKASRRGPRGPRGYRGYRGPRGFQGPPGDTSPSNAYEASWTTTVPITGTSPETATVVKTTSLPLGKYIVTAQIQLAGAGANAYCRGRGPGPTGPYVGQPAWLKISSADSALSLVFGIDLPTDGSISIACWQPGTIGADAGPGEIAAIRVGSLTPAG